MSAQTGEFVMSSSPRHRMLEVEELGNVTLVRILHRKIHDEQEIRTIGQQLFSLADAGRVRLAIDFANVEFLTSAMTGKLIALQRKVKAQGGRLALCQLSTNLVELLRRAGLSRMFELYPTLAEGLASFGPAE